MIPPQANHSQLKPNPPPTRVHPISRRYCSHARLPPLAANRFNRLHIFSSLRDLVPATPSSFLFDPSFPPSPSYYSSSPQRPRPPQLARRIYGTRDHSAAHRF